MATRKQTPSAAAPGEDAPLPPLSVKTIGRLRSVGRAFGDAKDKRISGRISAALLATVKHRLSVASDTEAIEIALANMAVTEDFGTWLVEQAGQLDPDFELEL